MENIDDLFTKFRASMNLATREKRAFIDDIRGDKPVENEEEGRRLHTMIPVKCLALECSWTHGRMHRRMAEYRDLAEL